MKNNLTSLLLVLFNSILLTNIKNDLMGVQKIIILSQDDIESIRTSDDPYIYFGPEVCSIAQDFALIQKNMIDKNIPCKNMTTICDYISKNKNIAPVSLIESALLESLEYLNNEKISSINNKVEIIKNIKDFYEKLESCELNLELENEAKSLDENNNLYQETEHTRNAQCSSVRSLKLCKLLADCLTVSGDATINGNLAVDGNETIGGNLIVNGDELVEGDLTVTGSLNITISPFFQGSIDLIGEPQQACIIFLDSSLNQKAQICSSAITGDNGVYVSVDGVTQNLRINNQGGTTIAAPTSGAALSVTGNTGSSAIVSTGNGTATAPALTLIGNPASAVGDSFLTVSSSGVVGETPFSTTGFILNDCQTGPLQIGTSDATSLTLATNGCTSRLSIDQNGAISVSMPTTGEALTVTGNIVLPAANAAGTQGILKLGGTGSTRVNLYEFGTANLFAGSGAVNSNVTGNNNISIGTNANSNLVTGNNAIAIGNTAQATASDAICIGNAANTSLARTIVIGSTDSTSTGAAPTATALNAIAIGSASSTLAGANSSGTASIAVGSSDGTFAGANAAGNFTISLGTNSSTNSNLGIAIGSSSGTIGGTGATSGNTNAIAIGSASGTNAGASSTGISSIAIGSADNATFTGAIASGSHSIAVGVNSVANSSGSISLGSASGTAGGSAPLASNNGAIAIGSGFSAEAGAIASGLSSIAIGGADGSGNFPGAVASGDRTISIGVNSTASSSQSIAIGSASGIGGTSATASQTNAIAIGSASGTTPGAFASGVASIAIGGANGAVSGASASGARSVAIGNGATTSLDDAIVLGNSSNTAVAVGIGTSAPGAKLDIVGSNGVIVFRMDQSNSAIANAPVWLNPSTSSTPGTPIHYNGSNQLFGFTSSKRYKTNIRKIDSESEIIHQLNPVIYDSKEGYGKGTDIPGFIAEEVYEVEPKLVVFNSNNEPETIAYNSLHALSIKEIQNHQNQLKLHKDTINHQNNLIDSLLEKIKNLETTLSNLEKTNI